MGVCDYGEMAVFVRMCISRDWFVVVKREMGVLVCVCAASWVCVDMEGEMGIVEGEQNMCVDRLGCVFGWKTGVCLCGGDYQGRDYGGRDWSLNVEEKL